MGMTRDEFIALVGTELVHRTPSVNLRGIQRHGLLRPVAALTRAGIDPRTAVLRRDPLAFRLDGEDVLLNHQRPLRAGRRKGAQFLDDGDVETWSAQLDERLFFWPGAGKGAAFGQSLDDRGGQIEFRFDSGWMFDTYRDALHLSPINSGSATRRPARRGPWLYVPVTADVESFRENRRRRNLVSGRDVVAEVSLLADIPAEAIPSVSRESPPRSSARTCR